MFAMNAAATLPREPHAALPGMPPADDGGDDYAQAAAVFSRTGGLATCDQVACLMRDRCSQPVSRLAHWIVGGALVSFERLGQRFIPMFQFDPEAMTLREGVDELVRTLSATRDEWHTALWFTRSHPGLRGATPADVIGQPSDRPSIAAVQCARSPAVIELADVARASS
ncbi:MAG: hypothetical protein JSR59_13950 [Proteobacteria bacterium]|nr:hypothetical protein [Pseudomonadota bacterium]